MKLKRIKDQVIVITGASSGIGLATARMAAKKGARVVLASRNTEDLHKIAAEINARGGQALAVTVDVSLMKDMQKLRDEALKKFGRIDTWVNNAGVAIFGPIYDAPPTEARRLFESNFWGVYNGCKVAIDAMKSSGGCIINLGSEASERAAPLLGLYSASKQAIRGLTEALRSELRDEKIPISLSLIRPASMDTPVVHHARNHMRRGEPSLANPTYHPDIAASAILFCAENPKRDVYVGGGSKFMSVAESLAPRLIDFLMIPFGIALEREGSNRKHREKDEGLMHPPAHEGEVRGNHKGYVMRTSLWTSMSLHPVMSAVAIFGLLAAGAVYMDSLRQEG